MVTAACAVPPDTSARPEAQGVQTRAKGHAGPTLVAGQHDHLHGTDHAKQRRMAAPPGTRHSQPNVHEHALPPGKRQKHTTPGNL